MKRLLIPLILLIVLGGVAIYLTTRSEQSTTLNDDISSFAVEDTAAVSKIFLADKGGNQLTLTRDEDGIHWRLDEDFPARADYVKVLLYTLNRLSVKAPVSKSEYNTRIKNLSSGGIKVEIYMGQEQPEKVFYVGSSNATHSGTYMMLEGAQVPFLMHIEGFKGYLGPRFSTNPNDWRSSKIFGYGQDDLATIKVTYPKKPQQSFQMDIDDNGIAVTAQLSGERVTGLDTASLLSYVSSYKKIHFENFEETKDEIFIDSVVASTPEVIYEVTDRQGVTKKVATYLKPAKDDGTDIDGNPIDHDLDRLYAHIDEKDFVVIQYFVFDNLAYTLDDFLSNTP